MKIQILFAITIASVLSLSSSTAHAGAAPKAVSVTSKSKEALAAFLAARDLAETSHLVEAEEGFKRAVALDPEFALAQAWLSGFQASNEGAATAAKAVALAKKLPEPERLSIDARVSFLLGDPKKGDDASKRLGELMPEDWRVQMLLAHRAMDGAPRDLDKAITHMKRAAELNPKSSDAWNSLGYAYLEQQKLDDSIAAFKKYAEAVPTDANAHDSLGDALMRAGKNAEAEASFQKAIAADSKFALAWSGVAMSRANRGDWNGAIAAMKTLVEKTPRALDKPESMLQLAWWQYAAGQAVDAEKTIVEAEKLSAELKLDNMSAVSALNRAVMANESGKGKDALKIIDEANARAAKGTMAPGSRLNVKLTSMQQTLWAHVALGAKADAAKASADLEREVKALPDDARRVAWLHEIHADTARAGGDLKAALAEYQQCWLFASSCLAHGIVTAEKVGDKAAADAMRGKLKENLMRDGGTVVARAQAKMFPTAAPPAKK